MDRSVYTQLRQMENTLNILWRSLDQQELTSAAQRSQGVLRRHLRLAQAISRDYQLSETEQNTQLQLRLLPKLIKELEQVRAAMLKASEYNVIGAVDVAQLSAQLDMLLNQLQ